ncbi:MAG: restriction endonuclease subunit M [Candidatus Lokiarchaeota archaeon]|nr:restriction endonuclease subunit M [Candidatus Lokiarchaeota archaeon]
MLTKNDIAKIKNGENGELLKLLNPNRDSFSLIFILDNLGRLPRDLDGQFFVPLTKHKNDKVRLLAVKNIGKLSSEKYLEVLDEISANDENTMIRREAISSIGRMRSRRTIPTLKKKLKDPDPKVVLQAIRGLLVFKGIPEVSEALYELKEHPNELIQSVIEKEFSHAEKRNSPKQLHAESPQYLKNVVVNSDVLKVLSIVPDESIHLTFTSPPYYNARDYSIYQSYKEYLGFLRDVFKEVHRITKEGRFFILNTSPIIIPRVSRQHSSKRYPIPFDIHPYLTEMGWEFIDDIVWVKPEASAKNRNAGFLQHRKPLGYKPNAISEYLMVYRKRTHKLLDWNIRQYDHKTVQESKVLGKYETSNVWHIDPTFDKTHTAVFPLELCHRVIRYYSYQGDLVFDPFGGSGTFGKAAYNLSRYFFLTELSKEYFNRIKENFQQSNLFSLKHPPKFFDFNQFKHLLKHLREATNDFD